MNLYVILLFIQTLLVHQLNVLTLSLIFANTQLYKDHGFIYTYLFKMLLQKNVSVLT